MTTPDTSRKHAEQVLAALTSGMSVRKTATELGLSDSTVKRISTENREYIAQVRAEQSRAVVQELKDRAMYAARRLEELIDSPNDAVAISAIRTALSEAMRWADAIDTEERLSALEQRLGLRVVVERC